jgi:hypothetical protein
MVVALGTTLIWSIKTSNAFMSAAEALPLGTPRAQVIALLGEYQRLDGIHGVQEHFLIGRLNHSRRGACDEKVPQRSYSSPARCRSAQWSSSTREVLLPASWLVAASEHGLKTDRCDRRSSNPTTWATPTGLFRI